MVHFRYLSWIANNASTGQTFNCGNGESEMGWREELNRATGPGITLGITTGDWLTLLARNGFEIPPRFWMRTAFSTLVSLVNTAWCYSAEATLSRSVARQQILPPVFILGHWRSGDDSFAQPALAR